MQRDKATNASVTKDMQGSAIVVHLTEAEYPRAEEGAAADGQTVRDWAGSRLRRVLEQAPLKRVLSGQSRRTRYTVYFCIFFGWIALILLFTDGVSDRSWLADWERWDAKWYAQIWREGYPAADPRALVFPPGYSFAVGFFAKLLSTPFFGTAIVLNLIAFFATAALISDWFLRKFGINSYSSFAFILSAPAAYFAFTAYSDVFFMLLLWVALWFSLADLHLSRAKRLIVQASMLLVLPWLRLTGYALVSWLLVGRVGGIAVLGSLGLWLGFNQWIAGSPFYFLHAQKLFLMPKGNFFQGLSYSFKQLIGYDFHAGNIEDWLQFCSLPMFYLVALTATAIWLLRKREGLLAITVLSVLLISHNQAFWRSAVRYDLPLMPMLCLPFLVASGSRSQPISYLSKTAVFLVLLAGQFALQFYFARIFHSGGWAF